MDYHQQLFWIEGLDLHRASEGSCANNLELYQSYQLYFVSNNWIDTTDNYFHETVLSCFDEL